MTVKLDIDGSKYELTQETFRRILTAAAFNLNRLKSDPECVVTKSELHALDVIRTFQYKHPGLL